MADETMTFDQMYFDVSREAFQFLKIQKGALDHLSVNPLKWILAYNESVHADFAEIAPHLPPATSRILDIGSGLGGINARINKFFGGNVDITLLDGECDPPEMILHRKTFNNMRIARDFLKHNGVRRFSYMTPEKHMPEPFDVILSLGSWCFHYEPAVYLDFVRKCVVPETVVIVDVRNDHPEWLAELVDGISGTARVIRRSVKFSRVAIS